MSFTEKWKNKSYMKQSHVIFITSFMMTMSVQCAIIHHVLFDRNLCEWGVRSNCFIHFHYSSGSPPKSYFLNDHKIKLISDYQEVDLGFTNIFCTLLLDFLPHANLSCHKSNSRFTRRKMRHSLSIKVLSHILWGLGLGGAKGIMPPWQISLSSSVPRTWRYKPSQGKRGVRVSKPMWEDL